jgi:methylated-DNA-protein-cysteine methyltransferase-like protein
MDNDSLFEKIRQIVAQIPVGKVSTYSLIGKSLGISDARKVGWAMAGTSDLSIPCHRVVNMEGKLAENFGSYGWEEQRDLLEAEGVTFVKDKYADLNKHLWIPTS